MDIDLLSTAVREGLVDPIFDLNSDGDVDNADRIVWVDEVRKTWFGDANMDSEFNSSDFVAVFVAGQYEDGVPKNSGWATGDWNGDAEFDSGDFVTAFVAGGYERGQREDAQVQVVPEPAAWLLLGICVGPLVSLRRRVHAVSGK